jgi:hypothetical protein
MTMGDRKRIAVIVRERPEEALRIAGGITLADDIVDVYVLDRKLDKSNPAVSDGLELVVDLNGQKVYSNNAENGFDTLALEAMAKKLLEYDIVLPY